MRSDLGAVTRRPFFRQGGSIQMSRRPLSLLAALSLVAILVTVPTLPASASYCVTGSLGGLFDNGHCYSTAVFPVSYGPSGISGAAVALYTYSLYSTGACQFVNNELWISEDSSSNYSVEQGQKDGANFSGCSFSNPYWFWADDRPCCGYYEHDEGVAVISQLYVDYIWQTAPNQYTLLFGPSGGPYTVSVSGLGGGDEGAPFALEAGSETTSTGGIANNGLAAYDYLYYYLNGNWDYGWGGAGLDPNGSPSCNYWYPGSTYQVDELASC